MSQASLAFQRGLQAYSQRLGGKFEFNDRIAMKVPALKVRADGRIIRGEILVSCCLIDDFQAVECYS